MNKVLMIGRLAADPEGRTTQSGKTMVTFRLAVNRDFTNANGVREADFIQCQAWGNTAEYIRKYHGKGSRIAVEGRLQVRNYEAQDGSKRTATEVVVDRAEGLQSKSEASDKPAADAEGYTEVPDDDLPF